MTKPFQCPKCIKGFCVQAQLTNHLFKHEIGENPDNAYFCSDCRGVFKV